MIKEYIGAGIKKAERRKKEKRKKERTDRFLESK
jgi:hypothetical protein